MPTVVSQGTLTDATFWGEWQRPGGLSLGASRWMDYAAIYRTQPHVRTMVDFIARNIAQLGIHVYERVGENDRQRLRDHPLAQLIGRPNGWTTRHRFVYGVMADRGIYGQSFALKVRGSVWGNIALLRIPPAIVEVKGGLVPTLYKVHLADRTMDVQPNEIIHFRNFNPDSPVIGLSPIESLRNLLDEDLASVEHRRDMWGNAGRQPMIIKRPKGAPKWGQEVAIRFSEQFTAALRSPKSLTTPILEDDMSVELLSFNAEQSQYVEARKLTREEVATAYHIPLSMVGIAGASSTFASVREFRKSLYVDTLGPWISELEEDLALQLFPDFENMESVYAEFNVMAKLAGSFEEQADMLQKAIGRPWMTADEGRARLNMPSKGGNADELAVPFNVDPTGQGANPSGEDDDATVATDGLTLAERVNSVGMLIRSGFLPDASLAAVGLPTIEHIGLLPVTLKDDDVEGAAPEAVAALRTEFLARQRSVITKRIATGTETVAAAWDDSRWNRELASDLADLGAIEPHRHAERINAEHREQLTSELDLSRNGHGAHAPALT